MRVLELEVSSEALGARIRAGRWYVSMFPSQLLLPLKLQPDVY